MAVNDGAVMMNWAKSQKVGLSMLQFLGDPNSELTKALVCISFFVESVIYLYAKSH